MSRRLTPKQAKFARIYAAGNLTAMEAATRAGYKNGAGDILDNPLVQAVIEEVKGAATERAKVTAQDVVDEWAKIAFSDVREIFSISEGGTVKVKESDSWPEDIACAVASIKQTDGKLGLGVDVKFHDKMRALDSLGKYLGILTDKSKHEITGPGGGALTLVDIIQNFRTPTEPEE